MRDYLAPLFPTFNGSAVTCEHVPMTVVNPDKPMPPAIDVIAQGLRSERESREAFSRTVTVRIVPRVKPGTISETALKALMLSFVNWSEDIHRAAEKFVFSAGGALEVDERETIGRQLFEEAKLLTNVIDVKVLVVE